MCLCGSVGVWLCVRGRCVVVRSAVARCGQSVRLCCSGGHITLASPELYFSSKLKYRSDYEPTKGKWTFNREILKIIRHKYFIMKVHVQIQYTCTDTLHNCCLFCLSAISYLFFFFKLGVPKNS